tara:strand:- start:745 stop:936 length:192 start_codon:yes stop_codon:yes gene_type:complete
MSKEDIERLAGEISFRLLATIKHSDHEWLIKRLDDTINKAKEEQKSMGSLLDDLPPIDYQVGN